LKTLLVLAGGFGTRLRSKVSDVPKPLAPVLKKPFLVHLIDHWLEQGIRDFVFLLHYEAHQIEVILGQLAVENKALNVRFRVIVEETPLGTGGAILNAIHEFGIEENFLVANGDTWLESGIQDISEHSPCVLAAINVNNSERYGSIELNGDEIINFQEKTKFSEGAYVNSGLYHLSHTIFSGFAPGSSFSLEKDIFPTLVSMGQLSAIKVNGNFIDIGVPEDYLKFCKWMELGKKDDL
jgi:D-glycero-alpha-D-manno-heptose 1-phosphate guanylyltransferase